MSCNIETPVASNSKWRISARRNARLSVTFLAAAMALTFAISFRPTAVLAQEGPVIGDIKVTGNKRVEPETVKSHLTFAAGQRYDARKVDESVKALFATNIFRDVHVTLKGNVVVISVVENPVVNRVTFEGNKQVGADTLSQTIQIKARGPYTQGRVQAAVQQILDVYRHQGYYAAQIDPKMIELDNNRVDLVFEIREGPETKVAGINFIGNRSYSATELRGAIGTTESSLLDFLKSTSIYNPDQLNLDRELLRRFYLKNGFADIRVVSATADVDPDGKGFFLTFTIDEGPRYTFGAVDLDVTLPSLNAETLRSHILNESGRIYNAETVEKTVAALTSDLAKKGYPFGQVRARIDRDPVTRTISVVYVVEQGRRIYIDRIDIVGNSRTHDEVIRRELRVAEGDPYNKILVEQGRLRLLKLGFFKEVKITQEKSSAPDRINLTVAVVEQQTGELAFAIGYSTSQGLIGEISYTERNLMGTGQYLQVKLTGGYVENGFNLSWTEPRFLDRNMSFGVDVFVKNSDYTASTGYLVAGYEDFRVGGSLRYGLPLTDNFTVSTNYTLMLDTVYNLDPNASLAIKEIQGSALISSVGYASVYDTRNNPKKPTEGVYIKGTQDFAGIGGDVNYIRSTTDMRAYYPVTQDITLAARAQGGTIAGWGGQNVRIVDAFYKGGETIPGFAPAGLGPRDAATGDALGGTTFYSATAELRFPLPFLPQDLGLSGAMFTSAGSLFGTDAMKFANAYVAQHGGTNTLIVQNSSIVRASAGGSIIWDSPVGPLRADLSGILSKAPFDKTQAFGFGYSPW
jgi:outer membrane protein insertion porin family